MELPIHVHVHIEPAAGVTDRLDRILSRLDQLEHQMTTNKEDFDAGFARINEATNNIAADIQALKDQIGTGMSQAEVDEVKAKLDAAATALEAVAAGQ